MIQKKIYTAGRCFSLTTYCLFEKKVEQLSDAANFD